MQFEIKSIPLYKERFGEGTYSLICDKKELANLTILPYPKWILRWYETIPKEESLERIFAHAFCTLDPRLNSYFGNNITLSNGAFADVITNLKDAVAVRFEETSRLTNLYLKNYLEYKMYCVERFFGFECQTIDYFFRGQFLDEARWQVEKSLDFNLSLNKTYETATERTFHVTLENMCLALPSIYFFLEHLNVAEPKAHAQNNAGKRFGPLSDEAAYAAERVAEFIKQQRTIETVLALGKNDSENGNLWK